jgi:acetyl-CoA C-acetyltransferase
LPLKNRIGIVGVTIDANSPDKLQSLEELQYQVTQQTLKDAGLKMEDIDGIVVAGNDQIDGRAITLMAASGSVGGVDRDILCTPSAAEHAFVLGTLRVATGQFRTQLIISWSPIDGSPLNEIQRLAADPYFNRALPIDEPAAHALQASVLHDRMPEIEGLAKLVIEKNKRHGKVANAKSAPGTVRAPWPLEQLTAPTRGLTALIIASSDFIAERKLKNVAWIEGIGWATEPSLIGDRDLSTLPSLQAAAKLAYKHANVKFPAKTFRVAEVSDYTPYQELLAYEGLGLCSRAEWSKKLADGTFASGGALPVNLSGGSQSSNPVFCSGLVRIAELGNQVRGAAGPHQLKDAHWGVAVASSGPAMQYNTVVVLSDGRKEAH